MSPGGCQWDFIEIQFTVVAKPADMSGKVTDVTDVGNIKVPILINVDNIGEATVMTFVGKMRSPSACGLFQDPYLG